jgi:Uma2 family endonuclease
LIFSAWRNCDKINDHNDQQKNFMVVTVNNSLTLREFLQLPETKPSQEFIDGQIIPKPMPQGKHSTIQGDLVPAINASLKPQQIARAYPQLRCTFGSRSLVPDVSVFLWENIPRDGEGKVLNTFAIAPDWLIEILSPDQNQTKSVISYQLSVISYQLSDVSFKLKLF